MHANACMQTNWAPAATYTGVLLRIYVAHRHIYMMKSQLTRTLDACDRSASMHPWKVRVRVNEHYNYTWLVINHTHMLIYAESHQRTHRAIDRSRAAAAVIDGQSWIPIYMLRLLLVMAVYIYRSNPRRRAHTVRHITVDL